MKHATLTYAQAVLTCSSADVKASLSPECRSADHITAQIWSLFRRFGERELGFSFDRIKVTGVQVQDVTTTSAQAEVEFNLSAAGNYNWVTYVLDNGRWKVGGQCAMPVGHSEFSSFSGGGP